VESPSVAEKLHRQFGDGLRHAERMAWKRRGRSWKSAPDPVLMLSMHPEETLVRQRDGARGYVLKNAVDLNWEPRFAEW